MTNSFIKLTNGAIIFVLGKDSTPNFVHGCNLDSPHLKPKTFPLSEIDPEWKMNPDCIKKKLKRSNAYVPTGKTKHSYANIKARYEQVMDAFQTVKQGRVVVAA